MNHSDSHQQSLKIIKPTDFKLMRILTEIFHYEHSMILDRWRLIGKLGKIKADLEFLQSSVAQSRILA